MNRHCHALTTTAKGRAVKPKRIGGVECAVERTRSENKLLRFNFSSPSAKIAHFISQHIYRSERITRVYFARTEPITERSQHFFRTIQ